MSWLSNSTLRRIIASEFFDSFERKPSASSVSSAAITGVSGVRSSCESIARKLSFVRFAASTASFCCSIAAWARLRSAIAAAIAIAVIVNAAVQDCSITSDWFSVRKMNGPKPWSVPQIAMAERIKMPVAVSRWVNRNAVQMTIGPQINEIG